MTASLADINTEMAQKSAKYCNNPYNGDAHVVYDITLKL